ncbi:LysM peptidoglycan-binding domain-containing protein [Fictibacillus sp. B-59209]|uniref:LysM peptidoglycan-binding domain-containing protein n=1 Tax=Fictibacillus sp. B-59209 TaxID=3024873 RepID=UPI002E1B2460|nr:LysM peptidoglycan-binding domain-containing protein [Fictibacillus sp. B-59209]
MHIHVVQQGDSLWGIAHHYGVDLQVIMNENDVRDPNSLVIGQALVIPPPFPRYRVQQGDTLYLIAGRWDTSVQAIVDRNNIEKTAYIYIGQELIIPVHVVHPGDSLYVISMKYGASIQGIAEENNLSAAHIIYPGQKLTIPFERPVKEINAYISSYTPAIQKEIHSKGKYLTYITPFSYTINKDGTLNPPKDEVVLPAAKSESISPLMVVTNFQNGTFDTELISAVLSDTSIQSKLLNTILSVMKNKGYKGVNFDFEYISPNQREAYNQFLRRTVSLFKPLGYITSTALAPKLSAGQKGILYEAHDYRAHGEIVDFVIVMTYEWGWIGGKPMAVAPLSEVKKVLEYALTEIPANKLVMGVPLYGYDWKLPFVQGTYAQTVSPQEAVDRARRYGASIQYDEKAQSPFYNYYDGSGAQHIVWFEDARSIKAKFTTAKQYQLRGISYWLLGPAFPQNWYVLQNEVKPKK